MKKLSAMFVLGLSLVSLTASAAVTVSYHNNDGQKVTFDVKCSGSSYKVSFDGSTTSSTTIQGSAPCKVSTPSGEVVLNGGEKVEVWSSKIVIK